MSVSLVPRCGPSHRPPPCLRKIIGCARPSPTPSHAAHTGGCRLLPTSPLPPLPIKYWISWGKQAPPAWILFPFRTSYLGTSLPFGRTWGCPSDARSGSPSSYPYHIPAESPCIDPYLGSHTPSACPGKSGTAAHAPALTAAAPTLLPRFPPSCPTPP